MARSIISLRSQAPARAISALTRSAFKVLSLSASAPQMPMMLSASLVAAAATQGAGSACGSVKGSAPVANAPCGSAIHRTEAAAVVQISAVKVPRIDWSYPCPGRGAAHLALLRRAGTHTFITAMGPGSAAHHAASAARCAASGARAARPLTHFQRHAAIDHQLDAGDVFRLVR